MGKQAFMNKKKLFTGNLGIELRVCCVACIRNMQTERG